jgi:hypothetical protein
MKAFSDYKDALTLRKYCRISRPQKNRVEGLDSDLNARDFDENIESFPHIDRRM